MTETASVLKPPSRTWAGYAARTCALLFAVPSFYWAFGGKFGADTVGREAAQLTWGKDPLVMAVVLVTAVLKVLGGLFALALVRPWGRIFPRWMLLTIGWGGALLLTLYGGGQAATQALVAAGAIHVPDDFDWWALYWHLFLWSPWFLVWGILLGLAVWHYQRVSHGRYQ